MLAHYHYGGPSGLPPLIILHGLFGAGSNWQSLAKRFSEKTTVYALDLPYHAGSKFVPVSSDCVYPDMAQAVLDWADAMGISRMTVLGHSMGGKVAMQVASIAPDRVAHLYVLDIAPRQYPPSHLRVFEGLRTANLGDTRTALDRHLVAYIPDSMQRAFFLKQATLQPEGGFLWSFDFAGLWEVYQGILSEPVLIGSRTQGVAATLIAGQQSDYMDKDGVQLFMQFFPSCEVHWLPTGHWVQVQAPNDVFAIVSRDLGGI